ncbi:MAG: Appr-1-p processing protein [Bauldia sp.]
MIHNVEGDILLSKAAAIAHGIAPADHFTNGLALSLRERFPAMVKDFRHYCRQSSPEPGEAWPWVGPREGGGSVCIVNLLTQEPSAVEGGLPGKATVPIVGRALKALARVVASEKLTSVALPRLATGVGGLVWADVEPLIGKHLGAAGIPVFVYKTFRPGVAAREAL